MSESARLFLPNGTRPSGGWEPEPEQPPKPKPGRLSPSRVVEALGRKFGVPHGTYVDDLSANHKTIWLCWSCRHKFGEEKAHYFYEKRLRVRGKCDGCRRWDVESHLFIHESLLAEPGGNTRHKQIWTPR